MSQQIMGVEKRLGLEQRGQLAHVERAAIARGRVGPEPEQGLHLRRAVVHNANQERSRAPGGNVGARRNRKGLNAFRGGQRRPPMRTERTGGQNLFRACPLHCRLQEVHVCVPVI